MAGAGVDISNHRSKKAEDLGGVEFEYVITVCGHAHETCPVLPGGTKVIHVGLNDPAKLAANDEERLAPYRRVRDEIREFAERLPCVCREFTL
jgi:arsenate reductase (thioredoxin)